MKITPQKGKVLIEPEEESKKTASGLHIVETKKEVGEESGRGVVVEVGEGVALKKGATVLFLKYGHVEIAADKKTYLIVDQEEVVAVVEE